MSSEKACDKKYKEGVNDLKTGLFALKFSKDYLSASQNFTEAAKGYRKLRLINKSIDAFQRACECNKHLKEHWECGCNYLEIAEMQIFDLELLEDGLKNLKEAAYHYHVAGKSQNAIRVFTDNANKFFIEKEYKKAEMILKLAYEECKDHSDDEVIRISFDEVVNNLVEVYCALEDYVQAIKLLGEYIQEQKKMSNVSKYKLSKNFMKFAILRIINGESYLLDDITSQMWDFKYEDTQEDISDLRKLVDSIEKLNKKDFNYCCNCAFSLFQSSLLKGLRKLYEKKEAEAGPALSGDNGKPAESKKIEEHKEQENKPAAGGNDDDDYL